MEEFFLTKMKMIFPTSKKGQGWGLDLMAAIIIFISGVIILFVFSINYNNQTQDTLNEMTYESRVASDLILSEDEFGILSAGKVNQTKLNAFNASYAQRKASFGLKDNFYFVMNNLEIDGASASYAGLINSSETENEIKITRITIYKNIPTKFELYVWS